MINSRQRTHVAVHMAEVWRDQDQVHQSNIRPWIGHSGHFEVWEEKVSWFVLELKYMIAYSRYIYNYNRQ